MKRRGQGEGSIRERPNGRWEARYRGADGKPRSIYTRTRREAVDRLRTALAEREQGIRPPDGKLTVAAFLTDWLEAQQQRIRPRTHQSYASTVRLYIVPSIGGIPIAKLQPEHLSGVVAGLTARGTLSPTTVRTAYAVIRTALGQALRQGKVIRNVATLTDPPRRNGREMHPLTRVQARTLIEGTRGDGLHALYVTALGTGLRQGELLALRWQDIDLARGELIVRHSLQRFTRELVETKTKRSRRTLRLPASVTAALAAHKDRQAVIPSPGSSSPPRPASRCTASMSPAHSSGLSGGSGCRSGASTTSGTRSLPWRWRPAKTSPS